MRMLKNWQYGTFAVLVGYWHTDSMLLFVYTGYTVVKYNIVLVPEDRLASEALIALAQAASSADQLAPNYLLKDPSKGSIPHISVFQFEIDDENTSRLFSGDRQVVLELIEQHVLCAWQEVLGVINTTTFNLVLPNTINYKHDTTGVFAGVSWAELVISKSENSMLQLFHDKVHERLLSIGLVCLNANGERYNPHFTLFTLPTTMLSKTKLLQTVPDDFKNSLQTVPVRPAVGCANDNWELTSIIHTMSVGFEKKPAK